MYLFIYVYLLTSTLSLSYSRKSKSLNTVPKWSAFSSRSFRESLGMDKSGADTSSVLLAMLECRSSSSELWLKITQTKTADVQNLHRFITRYVCCLGCKPLQALQSGKGFQVDALFSKRSNTRCTNITIKCETQSGAKRSARGSGGSRISSF